MKSNSQLEPLLSSNTVTSPSTSGSMVGTLKNHHWNYSNITQRHPYSRIIVFLAAITIISSMYCIHKYNNEYNTIVFVAPNSYTTTKDDIESVNTISVENKELYVVYNNKCHIPNLDPFNEDVRPYMKRRDFTPCTKYDPLTYVEKIGNESILHIDNNMRKSYALYGKLVCCYSVVRRGKENAKSKKPIDNSYLVDNCINFEKSAVLNSSIEFLIVKCDQKTKRKKENVYSNAHTIVPMKEDVRQRLDNFKQNDSAQPISVIMIGIDSISRLNFYRSMPKTANYIRSKGWFELRGYNKIDDNTFPNVMGIFTGYNNSQAYTICNPKKPNKLDECPLILYKYRDHGYATAYAEDEETINTFNYHKTGFNHQPTDHYIRPLFLATQKSLKIKRINGLDFCVGPETSEEIVLNFANQFIDTYKKDSYFGFFWMNSFSHNELNEPSMLDFQTKLWFDMVENTGLFNTSIVIFLSDHGIRFGDFRGTNSGWLEERLPFIFIWLPEWFRKKFPTAVKNLKMNENRFTTPYDLHITLQDILIKSGRLKQITPSLACPKCRSLFDEIPFHRGCEDANINLHWCTCYCFKKVSKDTSDIKEAGKLFVNTIQNILSKNNETRLLCHQPSLKRIMDARESQLVTANIKYYLLTIEINPSGKFEGTIAETTESNGQKSFELKGDISRIDMYGSQSHCINDAYYKKYCYCKKQKH